MMTGNAYRFFDVAENINVTLFKRTVCILYVRLQSQNIDLYRIGSNRGGCTSGKSGLRRVYAINDPSAIGVCPGFRISEKRRDVLVYGVDGQPMG